VLDDGVLFVAPTDADSLQALRARDGKLVWSAYRDDAKYLLGVAGRNVIVCGEKRVIARDRETGELLWKAPLPEPAFGRGGMSDTTAYVPTAHGLRRFSVSDGKAAGMVKFSGPSASGNTVIARSGYGTWLVTCSSTAVNMYYDPDEIVSAARERGAAEMSFVKGETAAGQGRNREAAGHYRAAGGGRPARRRLYETLYEMGAWKEACEAAVSPEDFARAGRRQAEEFEKAGKRAEAVESYQAVLESGARGEYELDGGVTADIRRHCAGRIRELIAAGGKEPYAKYETDAAGILARAGEKAEEEVAARFPNAAVAPAAMAKIALAEPLTRESFHAAGEVLNMWPDSDEAEDIASFFTADDGLRRPAPGAIRAPVSRKWVEPNMDPDLIQYVLTTARLAQGSTAIVVGRSRNDVLSLAVRAHLVETGREIWKVKLHSPGAPPVYLRYWTAAGGRLIIATLTDIFGVDVEKGEIAWQYQTTGWLHGVRAAGRILAYASSDAVGALDAVCGIVLWTRRTSAYTYDGPFPHRGTVAWFYRMPDRMVYADLMSGAILRSEPFGGYGYRGKQNEVYFESHGDRLLSVTGRTARMYGITGMKQLLEKPVLDHSVVDRGTGAVGYVHTISGSPTVSVFDMEKGALLWSGIASDDVVTFRDGRSYHCRNEGRTLACRDVATRKELWSVGLIASGDLTKAEFAGNVGVFAGSATGGAQKMVRVAVVDVKEGKLLHEYTFRATTILSDRFHGGVSLALADGHIVTCTQSGLAAHTHVGTGKLAEQIEEAVGAVKAAPGEFDRRLRAAELLSAALRYDEAVDVLAGADAGMPGRDDLQAVVSRVRELRNSRAARRPAPPVTVPRAEGAPELHGLMKNWPEPAWTFDQHRWVSYSGDRKIGPWGGAKDLSASVRVTWDDDGFYLAADVTDDEQTASPGLDGRKKRWWPRQLVKGSDSLLVSFRTTQADGRKLTSEFAYLLYEGNAEEQRLAWPREIRLRRDTPGPKFIIERDEEKKRTVYRIAFPWKFVCVPEGKAAEGTEFEIAFRVFDLDKDNPGRAVGPRPASLDLEPFSFVPVRLME